MQPTPMLHERRCCTSCKDHAYSLQSILAPLVCSLPRSLEKRDSDPLGSGTHPIGFKYRSRATISLLLATFSSRGMYSAILLFGIENISHVKFST